jgi:hypothetical protein
MTAGWSRATVARMTQIAAAPVDRVAKAAGLAYILPALGFGIPTPFVLWHLVRELELPMTPFGFRSHAGPFEDLGRDRFVALGIVLMVSCLVDVLAGTWLWKGRRRGAILGLAATPLTLLMSYGFAFPFLFLAIPVRLALTVVAWPRLR